MAPVLEIRGLEKGFRGHLGVGRTVAVHGLDLVVEPGQVIGLLGPNGAGKSTTIKLVLGLLKPDRGAIRVLGGSPFDPATRGRIGFLPEHPYFYDWLTAEEFLEFYGTLRGMSSRSMAHRNREILARVGLESTSGLPLRKYSKGMVQRLGLAQAVQHDPDLVILDEPMSGLDPAGRRDVRDLILELRDAGKTVFFSSHILQDAEALCDDVAILVAGKLRAHGRLRELVSGNIRWYEITVRGDVSPLEGAERVSHAGGATLLRVTHVEALGTVLAALHARGDVVEAVWPRRESLEDLFLRHVGRSAPVEVGS
jgi:ABC-2 type transport system ATP-binding protein